MVFIFITVVVDVLALGIIIPALPKLVEGFLGGNTARAAEIFGLFNTVWALMRYIFRMILPTFIGTSRTVCWAPGLESSTMTPYGLCASTSRRIVGSTP
ncbi:MAG TPA: hypothetical protein VE715_15840 [Blastocatellia bacterium]|nr:hypothetical protein [Blastocatellia bacterium]